MTVEMSKFRLKNLTLVLTYLLVLCLALAWLAVKVDTTQVIMHDNNYLVFTELLTPGQAKDVILTHNRLAWSIYWSAFVLVVASTAIPLGYWVLIARTKKGCSGPTDCE